MIHVTTNEASTPAISEKQWRYITALDWSTPHTQRVREATGVPTLCVAYDPNPERANGPCWLIAQRVICKVFRSGGRREILGTHSIPYTWAEWRNDDGTARSIDDPRLIPFIQSRDRVRRGHIIDAERDAVDAKREQDDDNARWEMANDPIVRQGFRRLGDQLGMVPHRKLGTEGGKISTANLWRRGAGAPQKPLIFNAQGLPAL